MSLLTLRIHKPEVLLVAGMTAVAVAVLAGSWAYVAASAPPDACWLQVLRASGATDATRECEAAYRSFLAIQDGLPRFVNPVSASMPWIAGLTLGIPVVSRELETGTAALAWSLTGGRTRWLLMRFIPILVMALMILAVVAWLSRELMDATYPWSQIGPGRLPDLATLGVEGPTVVAQGVAALGVGLLVGALARRTMPAFAIGAVLSLGLALSLGAGLQAVVAAQVAEWKPLGEREHNSHSLTRLDQGYKEGDGPVLSYAEAVLLARERCPRCISNDEGEDAWIYKNLEVWERIVPADAYGTFELAHTAAGLGIGGACALLTFPIVSRRRPGP